MIKQRGLIEELLSKPIPQEVWHYTTLAGLEGILSTNTVFATEVHFTTDQSEFVHAREVALGYLNALKPTDESSEYAKSSAEEMVGHAFTLGVLSKHNTEVYVASFSAAKDLKSQWVEYADRYTGVSLAFDLRDIRPPLEMKIGVTFAPCVYAKDEQEELIEAALSHFVKSVRMLHKQSGDPVWVDEQSRNWKLVQNAYGLPTDAYSFKQYMSQELFAKLHEATMLSSFDLLRLASHCKNPLYEEEAEWRLALPRMKNSPLINNKIQFRGRGNDIPYMASSLFKKGERLPVTEVMLGALCEDRANVEHILEKTGYPVSITESAIPMRKMH